MDTNPHAYKLCSHLTRTMGLPLPSWSRTMSSKKRETTALAFQTTVICERDIARNFPSQIRLMRSLPQSRPFFPGPDWADVLSTFDSAIVTLGLRYPNSPDEEVVLIIKTKQNVSPPVGVNLKVRSQDLATHSLLLLVYPNGTPSDPEPGQTYLLHRTRGSKTSTIYQFIHKQLLSWTCACSGYAYTVRGVCPELKVSSPLSMYLPQKLTSETWYGQVLLAAINKIGK